MPANQPIQSISASRRILSSGTAKAGWKLKDNNCFYHPDVSSCTWKWNSFPNQIGLFCRIWWRYWRCRFFFSWGSWLSGKTCGLEKSTVLSSDWPLMRKIAQETARETQQPKAVSPRGRFFLLQIAASPWDMVSRKKRGGFLPAFAPGSNVILGNDHMTC